MRKVISVLLLLLMLVSCKDAGIGKSRDKLYSAAGEYFDGVIINIDGNSLIVGPYDGEEIKMSADKVSVYVDNVDKFKTGDSIRVLYDGEIMETYPVKVKNPAEVYLLSEISLEGPKYEVCYANHTDSASLYLGSLNRDKMYESKYLHLPVYKFDDNSALEGFRKNFEDDLTFDQGYDDIPSFDELTKKYDDGYFKDNSLIVCYVSSGSGSNRYGVKKIYNDGHNFRITITQTISPEVGTCDMAGWMIFVEVSKDEIKNTEEFDCILN